MKIAGFQRNSFVDYPGKIAAVVFTPGCNLNCYYCHNLQLLEPVADADLIPEHVVYEHLATRKKFLEALVVTGGEPTLQPDLEEFMIMAKSLGYEVKLDSNGTNPEVIKRIIDARLADYIAMDIKAPFEKYKEICGTDLLTEKIDESIDVLMQGGVQYEFRTTFVAHLSGDDIEHLAARIKGAKKYVLQQVRYLDEGGRSKQIRQVAPHSAAFIRDIADRIKGLVETCDVRGLSY